MSFWYYDAGDRHFCYSKEPTFVCPLATAAWEQEEIGLAAERLDILADDLAKLLVAQHRSRGSSRRRVDGKLTDACATCGHRMKRLGFSAWIERPPTDEERDTAQARIAEHLGFSDWKREDYRYFDTKREAKTWAYEEMRIRKMAAAEAAHA